MVMSFEAWYVVTSSPFMVAPPSTLTVKVFALIIFWSVPSPTNALTVIEVSEPMAKTSVALADFTMYGFSTMFFSVCPMMNIDVFERTFAIS